MQEQREYLNESLKQTEKVHDALEQALWRVHVATRMQLEHLPYEGLRCM